MKLCERSTESLLPLKLQEYLWEKTGPALQNTLIPGKYESACTALERLLLSERTKELKVRLHDVYSALKSISRWTFVKGALPYVIHCCGNILSQRRQPKLDLLDKLSPSVTKLFATLHWVLLEAPKECEHNECPMELSLVELFIEIMIPKMHNLYESDLVLSLHNGIHIWQPLWNHNCPVETYFAYPVIKGKRRVDGDQIVTVATYFDVAVLKILALDNWHLHGYRWGILYLQNHLYMKLLSQGFELETCSVLKHLQQCHVKKHHLFMETGHESHSPWFNKRSTANSSYLPDNEIPDSVSKYVSLDGELSMVSILGVLKMLVKRECLLPLSGNMVLLTCQLTEFFLQSKPGVINHLRSSHGSLLSCFVSVFKLLGCEKRCRIGFKGFKDNSYRVLLQKYFSRILNMDTEYSVIYFHNYIKYAALHELLSFLHSFLGFCDSAHHITQPHYHSTLTPTDHQPTLLSSPDYLHSKTLCEKLLFEHCGTAVVQNIMKMWMEAGDFENADQNTSMLLFTKYIHTKYPLVYRKVLMTGLLDSFDVSELPTNNLQEESVIEDNAKSNSLEKSSPLSLRDLSTSGLNSTGSKLKKAGGKGRFNRLWNLKTIDESDNFGQYRGLSSSLPGSGISNIGSSNSATLPRAFKPGQDEVGFEKRKVIDVEGLHRGLLYLRALLQLSPPGKCVEECVVAAMLDLKAPTIARACYLLELARFVRDCNQQMWPVSIRSSFSAKQETTEKLKHKVGGMFHRWGAVLGKKLDRLLSKDLNKEQSTAVEENVFGNEKITYMYEGHISLLSSHSPTSLRLLACHLLKEITAFLRETYNTIDLSKELPRIRTQSSDTERLMSPPKRPSQPMLGKKAFFSKGQRKASFGYLLSSQETPTKPSSPTSRVNRRKSVSQLHTGSPKVTRSYSRRVSLPTFEKMFSVSMNENTTPEHIDFPWLNTIIRMNKAVDLLCSHPMGACTLGCYVEQATNSSMLFSALRSVYDGSFQQKEEIKTTWIYFKTNVSSLCATPFKALCKGALVMDNHQLQEAMLSAWEVLLYPGEERKAAAASFFLVISNRLGVTVRSFLDKQFSTSQTSLREKAVERLGVLWDNQYHVYEHLEENSKQKVSMLKLDYTVPSRSVGEEPGIAPDAPWFPNAIDYIDFNVLDDDDYVDFGEERLNEVKQCKRMQRLRGMREEYLISAVPFTFQCSLEYVVYEEDDMKDASLFPVQSFFPQIMSSCLHHLIHCLDDTSVATHNSQSIATLCEHIIWKCLVDHPGIFFRSFFENLTRPKKQDDLLLLLRKLLFHFPLLPPHAAQELLNNLIGIIMWHNRRNKVSDNERIGSLLNILWMTVPSVQGVYFPSMKQSLRREHVDHVIMATANVAGAKEIIVVHNKTKMKFSCLEDMKFKQLLRQCAQEFDVTDANNNILVDKYTGYMLDANTRIRDMYVYKRGHPGPTLKLDQVDPAVVFKTMQKQALTNKLKLTNQLLFTKKIYDHHPTKKHTMFLLTELCQQINFPQRAIDLEFDLCAGSEFGQELFAVDVIYKDTWVKFISNFLHRLSFTPMFWEESIGLFLDPINGTLLLHSEDVLILKVCLAAYINIALDYSQIFSISGYSETLPTILRVYFYQESNKLVKDAIEFTVGQLFIIHQSPFILQLLASAAPILAFDDAVDPASDEAELVPGHCLFSLLESLDEPKVDYLDIMSLVHAEKPLKVSDYCIEDEANKTSNKVDLSIRLALTIIAYKPESNRALQMMFVLSVLLPCYARSLEENTARCPNETEAMNNERRQIKALITYVSTIVNQTSFLSSTYHSDGSVVSESSTNPDIHGNMLWNSLRNIFSSIRKWFAKTTYEENEEDGYERVAVFGAEENSIIINPTDKKEQQSVSSFYQPRTVLLMLVSEFVINATGRYSFLQQETKQTGKTNSPGGAVVLDDQAMVLLDVVNSLLSLVLFDHNVLQNPGLLKFLLEAMPLIQWSEHLVPFALLIKKIHRTFSRILKRPEIIRFLDWRGLECLVKGVYSTLKKQECLADVPEMKDLLNTCTRILIGDFVHHPLEMQTIPVTFCNAVLKVAGRLLHARPKLYNLRDNFACYIQSSHTSLVERFLTQWLLPLCIRMGTGRFDYPRMPLEDADFVLSVLISILFPARKPSNRELFRPIKMLSHFGMQLGGKEDVSNSLARVCFLGLKILVTVNDKSFTKKRKTVIQAFETYLVKYGENDLVIWNFVEFIVNFRPTLYIHILPIVRKKLAMADTYSASIQRICSRIQRSLKNPQMPVNKSKIIQRLITDLATCSIGKILESSQQTDEFVLSDVPPDKKRHVSAEEDDAEYISRVRGDQKPMHELRLHSFRNGDESKQSSFKKSATVRGIKLHIASMSKRSKRNILRRQKDIEDTKIEMEECPGKDLIEDDETEQRQKALSLSRSPGLKKKENLSIHFANLPSQQKRYSQQKCNEGSVAEEEPDDTAF